MCRAKNKGGRRCPGRSTPTTASAPSPDPGTSQTREPIRLVASGDDVVDSMIGERIERIGPSDRVGPSDWVGPIDLSSYGPGVVTGTASDAGAVPDARIVMVRSGKAKVGAQTAVKIGDTAVPNRTPEPSKAERKAAKRAAKRAEKAERWATVDRELNTATAEIDGSTWNRTRSNLLLSPISRQKNCSDNGDDPTIYDAQVAEGRRMLTQILIENGASPDEAAQKVQRLETAYTTWKNTPEVTQ
jgi:hypothetical protein